jgi:hypothetical protein
MKDSNGIDYYNPAKDQAAAEALAHHEFIRMARMAKLAENKAVDHPSHYGGKDNTYEAIKVIRAWNLGFSLGNTVKYISRAGKKDPSKRVEDLKKAMWYLQEEIKYEIKRSTEQTP